MGNHYHLLIETPGANLSRGMQLLNGIYTQRFNHKHKRVGHVLQGRFKSILVEKESHLLELARYIVLTVPLPLVGGVRGGGSSGELKPGSGEDRSPSAAVSME
jgi:hypothetical protein